MPTGIFIPDGATRVCLHAELDRRRIGKNGGVEDQLLRRYRGRSHQTPAKNAMARMSYSRGWDRILSSIAPMFEFAGPAAHGKCFPRAHIAPSDCVSRSPLTLILEDSDQNRIGRCHFPPAHIADEACIDWPVCLVRDAAGKGSCNCEFRMVLVGFRTPRQNTFIINQLEESGLSR